MPRLRGALILVDGRRTDEDLRSLISVEPDGTLKTLLEQGYIELLGPPPKAAAAVDAPKRRSEAAARAPSVADVRRAAVRQLLELLGPVAEGMAMRIEKATTWNELLPSLNIACAMVREKRGTAAAIGFAERYVTPYEGEK